MLFSFYRLPSFNARIGIAVDGTTIAYTFLAEGCSRKGKPGAFEYTRRNPDRRKAASALLCDAKIGATIRKVKVRGGKAINGPEEVETVADALSAFRRGGNYRFELQGETADRDLATAEAVAGALGLDAVDNRPVSVCLF